MPAYVTALVAVTNPQEILTYAEQVDATVAQYGGRFIVKGGPVAEVLEGDLRPHTVTILEFPTLERAQARGIAHRSIGRSSAIAIGRAVVTSFSLSACRISEVVRAGGLACPDSG